VVRLGPITPGLAMEVQSPAKAVHMADLKSCSEDWPGARSEARSQALARASAALPSRSATIGASPGALYPVLLPGRSLRERVIALAMFSGLDGLRSLIARQNHRSTGTTAAALQQILAARRQLSPSLSRTLSPISGAGGDRKAAITSAAAEAALCIDSALEDLCRPFTAPRCAPSISTPCSRFQSDAPPWASSATEWQAYIVASKDPALLAGLYALAEMALASRQRRTGAPWQDFQNLPNLVALTAAALRSPEDLRLHQQAMAAAQVGVDMRRAFWMTAADHDYSQALLSLADWVPARGLHWASAYLLRSLPVPHVRRHQGDSGAIVTDIKVNWTFHLTHRTGTTGADAWELAREYPEMASDFYHWILRIPRDELIMGSRQILGQLSLTSHWATTACLQALLDAKVPLPKILSDLQAARGPIDTLPTREVADRTRLARKARAQGGGVMSPLENVMKAVPVRLKPDSLFYRTWSRDRTEERYELDTAAVHQMHTWLLATALPLPGAAPAPSGDTPETAMQALHCLYTLLDGTVRHEFPGRIGELRLLLKAQVSLEFLEHMTKLGFGSGRGLPPGPLAGTTIKASDIQQIIGWLDQFVVEGVGPAFNSDRASSQASAAASGAEPTARPD
jgi:hypothetical protein